MAKKVPLTDLNLKGITDGANLSANLTNEYITIDVDKIDPNPYQPRVDVGDVSELAESIKKHGLKQPIGVSPAANGRYIQRFGHRRLEAHKVGGLKKIKAIIVKADNKTLFDDAMIENFHRLDVSPLEYAKKFQEAIDEGLYKNQNEIAEALDMSKSKMSKIMSILKLDEEVKTSLEEDSNPIGYATLSELARAPREQQKELYVQLKEKTIKRNDLKTNQTRISTLSTPKKNANMLTIKHDEHGKLILSDGLDFPLYEEFKRMIENYNTQGVNDASR